MVYRHNQPLGTSLCKREKDTNITLRVLGVQSKPFSSLNLLWSKIMDKLVMGSHRNLSASQSPLKSPL